MSRIVTFTEYGSPEVLKIVDADVPAPGPDEIRIRVKAIGLNRAESMWRTGVYVEPVKLPGRLGYEASGIVDAIGATVTHLAVGDEVTTIAGTFPLDAIVEAHRALERNEHVGKIIVTV